MFPVNIAKLLGIAFFIEHPQWLLLERGALMVPATVEEKIVKIF